MVNDVKWERPLSEDEKRVKMRKRKEMAVRERERKKGLVPILRVMR
jgi:hypothetical protein